MLSPIYEQCLAAYNKGGFTAACGSEMTDMKKYRFVFSGQTIDEALQIEAPDSLTATQILHSTHPELNGCYSVSEWRNNDWVDLDD